MAKLEGIFPILNTTFHKDGSLDLKCQARLVNYLLESGAHGLGLFGIASEGYALSGAERVELLKLIVNEVQGRVPLVVSSGHTATVTAAELSKQAEGLGADALMVLPPYFLKTDCDGLLFYYDAIGKAVNIPIMVQDAPSMTEVNMPAALLARMAREIEHVEYVKVEAPPTAPKVTALLEAGAGKVIAFGGLNCQFMLEEMNRGARGMMPGSDLIPEFVEIWRRHEAGDRDGAWRLFTRVLPLARFELQPAMGVSAMKNNLKAAGIIRSATVRHPTAELDARSLWGEPLL